MPRRGRTVAADEDWQRLRRYVEGLEQVLEEAGRALDAADELAAACAVSALSTDYQRAAEPVRTYLRVGSPLEQQKARRTAWQRQKPKTEDQGGEGRCD